MDMAVRMVVLLHTGVHIWIHRRIDAGVHRWVQQRGVSWCRLDRSNHRHILHRRVGRFLVMVVRMVVCGVLEMWVEVLLLVLEVLVWVPLKMLVVEHVGLVTDSSGSGGGGSGSTLTSVQRLFHQGSGVLGALLLAANSGEVGLRRVVVCRVDHAQDPHLSLALILLVAVELIVLLNLLGLILLWRVQVGDQAVTTLGPLGVCHTLSLCSVLDGSSERSRTLALEVHRLWLGRVDDDLALFLLVKHRLHVLHQIQLTVEGLDDVPLAVAGNEEPTVLIVNTSRWHPHWVLVGWHLLLVQLLLQLVVWREMLLHWNVLHQVVLLHLVVLLLHLVVLLHLMML